MPSFYVICIDGQIDPSWSEWLGGMNITTLEDGNSQLSGSVTDQAALQNCKVLCQRLSSP